MPEHVKSGGRARALDEATLNWQVQDCRNQLDRTVKQLVALRVFCHTFANELSEAEALRLRKGVDDACA